MHTLATEREIAKAYLGLRLKRDATPEAVKAHFSSFYSQLRAKGVRGGQEVKMGGIAVSLPLLRDWYTLALTDAVRRSPPPEKKKKKGKAPSAARLSAQEYQHLMSTAKEAAYKLLAKIDIPEKEHSVLDLQATAVKVWVEKGKSSGRARSPMSATVADMAEDIKGSQLYKTLRRDARKRVGPEIIDVTGSREGIEEVLERGLDLHLREVVGDFIARLRTQGGPRPGRADEANLLLLHLGEIVPSLGPQPPILSERVGRKQRGVEDLRPTTAMVDLVEFHPNKWRETPCPTCGRISRLLKIRQNKVSVSIDRLLAQMKAEF